MSQFIKDQDTLNQTIDNLIIEFLKKYGEEKPEIDNIREKVNFMVNGDLFDMDIKLILTVKEGLIKGTTNELTEKLTRELPPEKENANITQTDIDSMRQKQQNIIDSQGLKFPPK